MEMFINRAWTEEPEILPIGNGEYKLISTGGSIDVRKCKIFLDCNVVVDIERYFWGERKIKPERREAIRDMLLAWNLDKGMSVPQPFWGSGVSEASINPWNGPLDTSRYRKAKFAVDTVFNWSKKEVNRYFASRHAPGQKFVNDYIRTDYEPLDMRYFVKPAYTFILKAMVLWRDNENRRKTEEGRMALYEEWVNWANTELRMISSYEQKFALTLFLGDGKSRDKIIRMLKLGGNEPFEKLQKRVWNCCWDIFHVRGTDFKRGDFSDTSLKESVALLSADDDPMLVRLGAQNAGMMRGPNGVEVAMAMIDVPDSHLKDSTRERIRAIHSSVRKAQSLRSIQKFSPDGMEDRFEAQCEEMERDSEEKSPSYALIGETNNRS